MKSLIAHHPATFEKVVKIKTNKESAMIMLAAMERYIQVYNVDVFPIDLIDYIINEEVKKAKQILETMILRYNHKLARISPGESLPELSLKFSIQQIMLIRHFLPWSDEDLNEARTMLQSIVYQCERVKHVLKVKINGTNL